MAVERYVIGHFADTVGIEAQGALCGDVWVQLPQGAGGAIAGIGQYFPSAKPGLGVVGFKVRTWHIHFAAHFQHGWPCVALQALAGW